MRKYLLLFLLSFSVIAGFSQSPEIKINEYKMPNWDVEKFVVVKMPFGKSTIEYIEGDEEGLRDAEDIIIETVCTDYPAGTSLQKLNEDRMAECMLEFPYLREKKSIKTYLYRQIKGSNKNKAAKLFHGVVIRYRPKQTAETMKQDMKKLEEMLNPPPVIESDISPVPPSDFSDAPAAKKPKDVPASGKGSSVKVEEEETPDPDLSKLRYCGAISDIYHKHRDRPRGFRNTDSSVVMDPSTAYKRHIIDASVYEQFKQYKLMTIYFCKNGFMKMANDLESIDTMAVKVDSLTGERTLAHYSMPDSTVFKIFKRNKWKDVNVVGDVTGSMYPYTGQLLIWLKLQSLDSFTTKFTFFNDGDMTPDNEKKIGTTGGIYSQKCKTFDEVKDLVKKTMERGGGGDAPENNIEALIRGEKEFPDNSYQVLIADNWAPVKDKTLIDKLTKPVRIVLCGVNEYGINVDYLNLARKTKGSVHLMEEDLLSLAAMHEGQVLKLGNRTFRIVDGEFKEIHDAVGPSIYKPRSI